MAAEWAIERTVRLSKRQSVTMTAGPAGFTCEWDPLPAPNSLTHKEIRKYKDARDKIVDEMAERLGGSIVIVDL